MKRTFHGWPSALKKVLNVHNNVCPGPYNPQIEFRSNPTTHYRDTCVQTGGTMSLYAHCVYCLFITTVELVNFRDACSELALLHDGQYFSSWKFEKFLGWVWFGVGYTLKNSLGLGLGWVWGTKNLGWVGPKIEPNAGPGDQHWKCALSCLVIGVATKCSRQNIPNKIFPTKHSQAKHSQAKYSRQNIPDKIFPVLKCSQRITNSNRRALHWPLVNLLSVVLYHWRAFVSSQSRVVERWAAWWPNELSPRFIP